MVFEAAPSKRFKIKDNSADIFLVSFLLLGDTGGLCFTFGQRHLGWGKGGSDGQKMGHRILFYGDSTQHRNGITFVLYHLDEQASSFRAPIWAPDFAVFGSDPIPASILSRAECSPSFSWLPLFDCLPHVGSHNPNALPVRMKFKHPSP